MILYQRIQMSTGAHVGEPADLPEHLVGLDDVSLANLPAALGPETLNELGLGDAGFLPVEVEDPTPPRPRTIARIDFMRRFTMQEQIALQGSADPIVKNVLFMLNIVTAVELDNADTQASVGYLEQSGLIAAGRATEILS